MTDRRNALVEGPTYVEEEEAYRAAFASAEGSPCVAVVSAVAEVVDASPEDLPPLSGVVDTDALDRLLEAAAVGTRRSDLRITFAYCDHEVELASYGLITVRPRESETPSSRPGG